MEAKDIKSAFEEALKMTKAIHLNLHFDFNGVKCCCAYWGTVEKGVENYNKAIKNGYKLAYNI